MVEEKKEIVGKTILNSGLVILAKGLNFIKQILIASILGATIETDIVSLAGGIISSADEILIATISTAMIPVYMRLKAGKETVAKEFASDISRVFLVISLGITVFFLVIAKGVAHIIAPTYNGTLMSQLAYYIRLYAFGPAFIVEAAVFTALLNANKCFYPAQLTRIVQALLTIGIALIVGDKLGVNLLVVAFFAAAIINTIMLIMLVRKYYGRSIGNPFCNKYVKEVLRLTLPLLFGQSLIFIGQLIDRIILSGFDEGSITAVGYSHMVIDLAVVIIITICTLLYTYITQYIVENRYKELANVVDVAGLSVVTIALFMAALVFFNSEDLITVLFAHGKVGKDAISVAVVSLKGYALMICMTAVKELFARVSNGYGDTKRPMINSMIGIIINVFLSITFSRFFGILGVTLATSISVTVSGILNYLLARSKNPEFKATRWIRRFPQWILGVISCAVISWYGQLTLKDINILCRLIIIVMISGIAYFLINFHVINYIFNRKDI